MLEVKNLFSGYGKSVVIRDISILVEKGQIATIIGPNGAGKTTFFRTVFGLLDAKEGEILFENDDLKKYPAEFRLKKGIAMVPQGRHVFPYLSVSDNLELGAYTRSDRKEIQDSLERWCTMFPILQARKNQNAGTLSGGEQQMLVIARGLMSRPKFLMLDEPSLGIAPFLVKEIFKTIDRINREENTTLLVVEQNATIALKVAHWGYVMESGEIHLRGSSEELLSNDRVKSVYLGKKD